MRCALVARGSWATLPLAAPHDQVALRRRLPHGRRNHLMPQGFQLLHAELPEGPSIDVKYRRVRCDPFVTMSHWELVPQGGASLATVMRTYKAAPS
jgi:hypothetical protein